MTPAQSQAPKPLGDTGQSERDGASTGAGAGAPPDNGSAVTIANGYPSMGRTVRDAWRERALLPRLGARVLIKRVVGTKLGRAWLVLRPLMDSLGKTLLFGGLLKVAAPGGIPYFVFLLAGLLVWRVFDQTAYFATRSFDFYRKVMRDINFPLVLAPLAAAAYPAVEIVVYGVVFAGAILFFWLTRGTLYLNVSPELLLVIPGFALALVIAIGVGLWTSVLNGKARDTRYTARYALELWLYVTPVIYPLSAVPAPYRWLAAVNPMAAPVELVKAGLIGTGTLSAWALAWSVAFACLAVVSGLWFFSREAPKSIDLHGAGGDDDELEEDS